LIEKEVIVPPLDLDLVTTKEGIDHIDLDHSIEKVGIVHLLDPDLMTEKEAKAEKDHLLDLDSMIEKEVDLKEKENLIEVIDLMIEVIEVIDLVVINLDMETGKEIPMIDLMIDLKEKVDLKENLWINLLKLMKI
jgi:hypothetical protein